MDSAVAGKTERYSEFLGTWNDADYRTNLLTLEVSSRGFIHTDSFDKLYQSFPVTRVIQVALETEVVHVCLLQSYRVWCKRNWRGPAASHVATD